MTRYVPRSSPDLSPVAQLLATDGIALTAPLYGPELLARINIAMDPIFKSQEEKSRSYVTVDDMVRLRLLDRIVGGEMRNLLLSIIPDPVLYHCHAYEISANSDKPHIFGENLAGWHRDPDCEYFEGDPTHVSVFVYLTDVGEADGPFEFSPTKPSNWVRSATPAISVTGAAGLSFAWSRAYYHRASPNYGPRRRRLLKLSVQPNAFPSAHIANENFQAALKAVAPGDEYLDLLLGRYQGADPPELARPRPVDAERLLPTGTLGIPEGQLAKAQARAKLREMQRWLLRTVGSHSADPGAVAAYD